MQFLCQVMDNLTDRCMPPSRRLFCTEFRLTQAWVRLLANKKPETRCTLLVQIKDMHQNKASLRTHQFGA
jgi:hypothetical protein